MIFPQQLTIISLQVDKECTGDDSTGVGPIGADPLILTLVLALVLLALVCACIAQKLAPAQKNSPDISARSAAFYNSGNTVKCYFVWFHKALLLS